MGHILARWPINKDERTFAVVEYIVTEIAASMREQMTVELRSLPEYLA